MASPKYITFALYDPVAGTPVAGVVGQLTFDTYKNEAGVDQAQPSFVEIGGGLYAFAPVPAANHGIAYIVNAGSATSVTPRRFGGFVRYEDWYTDNCDIASSTINTTVQALRTDYTTARAGYLDFLDVATSSRAAASDLTTLTNTVNSFRADYTTVRATKIDNLDATISSRASASSLSGLITTVNTNLDTTITSRASGANLASMQSDVTLLRNWNEGKWVIVTSGPDVNKLVFYKPDGVTVIAKFNLFDANGNPTTINPFTRTPA